jgi:Tfp pilus assembly protein PilX
MEATVNSTRLDQRGSALIIAVIAMLILGILSFSFALLSRVEMTTGVNYKFQAQAEALAEAGLERGRDEVRAAADSGCGFTQWTDPGNSSSYPGCGAGLAKLLFNGVGLGAGNYSVVIDNDCSPLVPVAIQDPSCSGGSPARDTNTTAVLTAWGTAANGQGRARVRGVLGIDNPWKHVCSNSSQDNPPGYCNEPANRNGNPNIVPADPNEYPGGPAAYDVLPTPMLGCSEIDPTLHGNVPGCSGARKVVTGDDRQNCNGGGQAYKGYFDCALTTPGPSTPACVKFNDTRHDGVYYKRVPALGALCPAGATGMVFVGDHSFDNVGSGETDGRNAYVLRGNGFYSGSVNQPGGKVTIQSATFYGTLVVEGDGQDSCSGNRDINLKNNGTMTTATTATTVIGGSRPVYGYPLTLLVYDPQLPVPTAANPYEPQKTCADLGAGNTLVNGIVYSGGAIEFNPISVNGSVLGFELQTQGGAQATYNYNPMYGNAAPPPGFPVGSGNTVVLVRKSFLVCVDYAADTAGGSACR